MNDQTDHVAAQKTPPSNRLRRWLIGGLLAVLLVVGTALIWLNTPYGKAWIVDQIAGVAPASGLQVKIGSIEGDIYGEAVLRDVTLLDPEGAFLTLREVELDWHPILWLVNGLDIDTLIARDGTLLRLPALLPGDPDAPILPDFDIRIGTLRVENLRLAEGIVGDGAPIVALEAEADIRSGRAYITAKGDMGDRDRLTLLLDAMPDEDIFDLEVDYQAPRGGVLAGLIGAQESYALALTGEGSWSAWDGTLFARRGAERIAAMKLANRSGRFRASGQLFVQDFLSGIAARAVGPALSIGAIGTLEDSLFDGGIALRGAGVRTSGSGAVDLAGNAFDNFAITAALTDPALLGEKFVLDGTTLEATLEGGFRDLDIAHEMRIASARAGPAELTDLVQQGIATYDGTRWTLPLDVTIARLLTGTGLVDSKLVNGTLGGTLIYSGQTLLSDDLRIAFPDAKAALSLKGDVAAGRYQLAGPVEAQRLTLDNVGELSGTAQISLDIRDSGAWALNSDIDARIPRVTNATLANLAGPDIRANGFVSLGSGTPVAFRDFRLRAEKLTVALNGKITGDRTSLAGRGTHRDYGPFTVEGVVGPSGPSAALVFANPLPAAGLKDVRVAISPTRDGFAIATSGDSLLGDFIGTLGLVAPADGPTRIAIESLRVWKTAITGDLTLAEGGADGALFLNGGGLNGSIGLAARGGGQGIAFAINANRAQFGGATPLSIARAEIEGNGYLKDGNSTLQANIQAQGLNYGAIFIGQLAGQAELTNGTGTATASIAGRRGGRFNLQMNADIAPQRIALVTRGEFAGKSIRMPRRAVFNKQGDGGWQLAPSLVQYGEGSVLLSGEFGGNQTRGSLQLDQMPLTLIDLAAADFGLGGSISGEVDFVTNRNGVPTGTARVAISDLTRSGLVLSSQPIDVALVADLGTSALDMRAIFKEGGAQRGRMQARISNLASSGSLANRLQSGTLKGQLRYSGPAEALWRLAAVEAFDLTGPVAVATNLTGTVANPQVRGSIASNGLRVQSALSGTDIREVTVRGSFAGSRLSLTRFAGKTPNGGTVSGSGTVDLQGLGPKGPTLDLRVAANNARLVNANGLDATITGPLRIISDGNGGTIAGRVEIDRASWKLGTANAAVALPQITTREINLPADVAPVRARSKPWRYLIDARARSRVDVDGLGLDSEWEANINIRGTTSDPRIGGRARVVRGFYSFAGTRFELVRGLIDFDANVPIDPRLDILAETRDNGLDVAVNVRGNALTPEISFSSTPSLPEEEILARLLFGGSVTELSATDALQLGSALASLRGGGGLDPINQLRTAIGLDRLRIVGADPALNRGTAVALGKNIGRKFYLEIVTDGQGYSATQAEFRVTSWLSLLASVSTIGRESVVAEISRDY